MNGTPVDLARIAGKVVQVSVDISTTSQVSVKRTIAQVGVTSTTVELAQTNSVQLSVNRGERKTAPSFHNTIFHSRR